MRFRLPIPASWQDFEFLCEQLWTEIWCDPNAQRNGRAGQEQHGVDIFGRPIYSSEYSGVQCKDKDGRLGSELKESELIKECVKAQKFRPTLATFTLATTAPRDGKIQGIARKLNSAGDLPFDVHVWSWDDLEAEILCRPNLTRCFYTKIPKDVDSNVVRIAASAPREQFLAFFSRPHLADALGPILTDHLVKVVYELCDNAYVHGRASHVQVSLDGAVLTVEDNGKSFNPLTDLDATKATSSGHLGSVVVDSFLRKFRDDIEPAYNRIERAGDETNLLQIAFDDLSRHKIVPEVFDLPVDTSVAFGRLGADRLAGSLSIPSGIKELVLTVSEPFFYSALAQFIRSVRQRLPDSVLLTVSYPREAQIDVMAQVFEGTRVEFRPR